MFSGRVGLIRGLLAIGLWVSTAGQAEAQAQGLAQRIAALEAAVAALQSNGAHALAPYVSVQTGPINGLAGPHVIITGANVHIRSGSGFTDDNTTTFLGGTGTGTLTGLGNLIIGYDETSFDFTPIHGTRTGSHTLVVGPAHVFSSWGGMVAGTLNTVTGASSSVSGGFNNTASGETSSISGGGASTASGRMSSVSGGSAHTASGSSSSVSGGNANNATGNNSSVCGGNLNTASGDRGSSVTGGELNTASGILSSVSGGRLHNVMGDFNWAAGTFSSGP